MNNSNENIALLNWLAEFQKKNNRKLKILHIGNIAANGYLNGKFQRRYDVEADVLCFDYYHIMGYPEWEDIAIRSDYKSDIRPRFAKSDILNYERPDWFVQGPLFLCFDYLFAKNSNNFKEQSRISKKINNYLYSRSGFNRVYLYNRWHLLKIFNFFANKILSRLPRRFFAKYMPKSFKEAFHNSLDKFKRKLRLLLSDHLPSIDIGHINDTVNALNYKYKECFPHRKYVFTVDDIRTYFFYKEKWEKLFSYYDIIQCYGTDPIFALLFSEKPYVAFEHGTLRTFTSDDSKINALTSFAYRKANHVFVTNGDCLEHAIKLGIQDFSPMIHPVDVDQHRSNLLRIAPAVRSTYNADVLLFCPLRHDWEIKGTEMHIKALALLKREALFGEKSVKLIMTNWGEDINKSRDLASLLGVHEDIIWVNPLCRLKMIELIHASDVVLDQTILPCFGSTAPQALACGIPVIMSYKPESTEWIFEEPAPIISAFNETEIVSGIKRALDKAWLVDFKSRAMAWIDKYHSPKVAVKKQLEIYKEIIDGINK